jgi:hypothetical protein
LHRHRVDDVGRHRDFFHQQTGDHGSLRRDLSQTGTYRQ